MEPGRICPKTKNNDHFFECAIFNLAVAGLAAQVRRSCWTLRACGACRLIAAAITPPHQSPSPPSLLSLSNHSRHHVVPEVPTSICLERTGSLKVRMPDLNCISTVKAPADTLQHSHSPPVTVRLNRFVENVYLFLGLYLVSLFAVRALFA